MGSVDSIIKFNNEYRRTFNEDLDILINNAGAVQDYFSLTEGIESSIMVNHIGHKLLTLLLLDKFNSEEARIINIASVAHTFSNYSVEDLKRLENNLSFDGEGDNWGIKKAFTQYGNSKLANIYFTQYLAEKLGSHIKSVAIHPGSVNSEFNRWLDNFHWIFKPFIWLLVNPVFWFISKSTSAGTQTTYVGIYEDFEKLENGSYLEDCKKGKLSNTAKDSKIRDEFMKYSWMLLDKVVNNKVKITKL